MLVMVLRAVHRRFTHAFFHDGWRQLEHCLQFCALQPTHVPQRRFLFAVVDILGWVNRSFWLQYSSKLGWASTLGKFSTVFEVALLDWVALLLWLQSSPMGGWSSALGEFSTVFEIVGWVALAVLLWQQLSPAVGWSSTLLGSGEFSLAVVLLSWQSLGCTCSLAIPASSLHPLRQLISSADCPPVQPSPPCSCSCSPLFRCSLIVVGWSFAPLDLICTSWKYCRHRSLTLENLSMKLVAGPTVVIVGKESCTWLVLWPKINMSYPNWCSWFA